MDGLLLTNSHGNTVSLTPVGAAMTSVVVPDRAGSCSNIVVDAGGSAGKIIGRYANRIAGGSFDLDGKTFKPARTKAATRCTAGPMASRNAHGMSSNNPTLV